MRMQGCSLNEHPFSMSWLHLPVTLQLPLRLLLPYAVVPHAFSSPHFQFSQSDGRLSYPSVCMMFKSWKNRRITRQARFKKQDRLFLCSHLYGIILKWSIIFRAIKKEQPEKNSSCPKCDSSRLYQVRGNAASNVYGDCIFSRSLKKGVFPVSRWKSGSLQPQKLFWGMLHGPPSGDL